MFGISSFAAGSTLSAKFFRYFRFYLQKKTNLKFYQILPIFFQSCKKGDFDAFIRDISEINALCIKKDCKPQCIGNSQCDPLLASADIKCIEAAVAKTKKNFKDHDSINQVEKLGNLLIAAEKAKAACIAKKQGPM